LGGFVPSGKTLTGTWGAFQAPEGRKTFVLSFPLPLKEGPEPIFLQPNEASKPGCPGRGDEGVPTAAPGKLCVYAMQYAGAPLPTASSFLKFSTTFEPAFEEYEIELGASPVGTLFQVNCTAECFVGGTWAVTEFEE
jgi:hypothetical protein